MNQEKNNEQTKGQKLVDQFIKTFDTLFDDKISNSIESFGLNRQALHSYAEIVDQINKGNVEYQKFLFCVIYNYIGDGISQTDAQYVAGQLSGLITELSKKYKSLAYGEEKTTKILNVLKDYTGYKEVSTT